jgi:hypothetical protein
MIDAGFIRYAIAQKTAQKELCDDAQRRAQLQREITHLGGMLECQR